MRRPAIVPRPSWRARPNLRRPNQSRLNQSRPNQSRLKLSRLGRVQLRTRVLAGVLAVTLVALVAFDVAAVKALRGYLVSKASSQLEEVLSLYQPLVVPRVAFAVEPVHRLVRPAQRDAAQWFQLLPGRASDIVIYGPRVTLPQKLGQFYVASVSGRGRRVFVGGSSDLRPRLPGDLRALVASRRAQTVISNDGRGQLLLRATREANATLVATTSLSNVSRTVSQLRLILIIGSAAAGLLVAAGVAWIVRRGLRPIETMAVQADRINAGDLTDRIGPHDPRSEVGRLGTALNGMLARIEADVDEREASQELMRRFFADASHELRNPLASLRANAELYQQGALTERAQVDEAMRRIALEAQRMSGLVDDMLRLARLDQQPARRLDPVNVTGLVQECAERAQVADGQRTWQVDVARGLATIGDEELLRRAVDNLLANVTAHTPAGTAAAVTAAGHGDTITIEVADNGPGVPAGQLPHIFGRFYRAGTQSYRPGSGLGLAIVTAIAAAHAGTAEAAPGDPVGLRITLTLPSAAADLDDYLAGDRPAARLQLAQGRQL
jgi:two-component system OmpR family sensor kinase